jgi:hypothetical protein
LAGVPSAAAAGLTETTVPGSANRRESARFLSVAVMEFLRAQRAMPGRWHSWVAGQHEKLRDAATGASRCGDIRESLTE